MKYRNGFVSNSSSSSFVVLLPDSFDIDEIDFSKYDYLMEEYETNKEKVKKAFQSLVRDSCLYHEDQHKEIETLQRILKPYIISEFESGPESGHTSLADKEKIRGILNED